MSELAQLRLLHPGWRDVVEVLVVAYALYRVLRLFHGTRTLQIVTGLAMLLLIYAAAWLRGRRDHYHRAGLIVALAVLSLAAPAQIVAVRAGRFPAPAWSPP